MLAASYLLSSSGIQYKYNDNRDNIRWLQKLKPNKKGLTPEIIAERADQVFQLLPHRINNLIIVNGNLLNFEMIQACVTVAEKYSDNIIVIPPLLSRMTYALQDIARMHNPPPEEVILVLTITDSLKDFVILQRNSNFELNIIEREFCQSTNECMKEFSRIYDKFLPHATIILVEDGFSEIVDKIRDQFNPENLFVRFYKRWDYLLMSGGLLRAPDVTHNDFDRRYLIPNFTMGIETIFPGNGYYSILPAQTKIPCEFYGFVGKPQSRTLFYSREYYQLFDELVDVKKEASKKRVWITGLPDQVIGYYDDRGVPYISPPPESPVMEKAAINVIVAPAEAPASSSSASPTIKEAPKITFIFKNEFFGVEIYQNALTQKIKDCNGNEWTPLYLSMADRIPEIGEKAKNDYHKLPKYVIYDIFEIIGKPLNEIKIDPKWGFHLTENNGILHFQIETLSGPRLIPQELVISAFLKTIKLRVESEMEKENSINGIHLSTSFKLSKTQKAIFEKAAAKSNLRLLSYTVTENE